MIHIRSCASVALLNSCVPVTASSAWREIQQHIRHAASSQVRVRKEISCVMTAMPHTKCASHIHIRIVFPYPVFPLFIMHETLLNLPGLIYNQLSRVSIKNVMILYESLRYPKRLYPFPLQKLNMLATENCLRYQQ